MRGSKADVFVLDEAAFGKPSLFNNIFVPGWVGGGKHVAGIVASSIGPSGNYFTELILEARRTEGTPDAIGTVVVQTMVCRRCEKRGGSAPNNCNHTNNQITSWQEADRRGVGQRLVTNDSASALQEQKNFIGSSTGNVFDKRSVTRFLLEDRFVPRCTRTCPSLLALIVDPNAAGDNDNNSESAVTIVARFNGSLVVCGIATRNTRGTTAYVNFIDDVAVAIQDDPWLRKARVVVLCEKNTGMASGTLELTALKDSRRYYHAVLSGEEPGICTTSANKHSYAVCLNKKLKDGTIMMLEDFLIVPTPEERSIRPNPKDLRAYMLQKMANQLNCCIWKQTTNARTGITVRGGWSGKSHGTQDDAAIVLSIASEMDTKWGTTTSTRKGKVESYITKNMSNDIVDRWGTSQKL